MTGRVLEVWWADHADRLLAVARGLTHGDEDAAQDLRAETFLRAATASFRGESSPYTFLYATLRNINIDRDRRIVGRGRKHGRRFQELPEDLADRRALDPSAFAEAAEAEAIVRATVARLSEKRRLAVERLMRGETLSVAASELGIGYRAMTSRTFQARAEIRRSLRVPRAEPFFFWLSA